MTRSTAPKLKPTFSLLIARGDFSDFNPDRSQIQRRDALLDEFVGTVQTLLPQLVKSSPLLYGVHADTHTRLVLLSGDNISDIEANQSLALKHKLSLGAIVVSNNAMDELEANDRESMVLFESDDCNSTLDTQLKTIRNETLKAFSDILLWVGNLPTEDSFTVGSVDLLIDSILDGKPILHLAEKGGIRVLDYSIMDESDTMLLQRRKLTVDSLEKLFKPLDEQHVRRELGFIVNPCLHIESRHYQPAERKLHDYFSEKLPGNLTRTLAGRIDKTFQSIICLEDILKVLFGSIPKPWYGVDVHKNCIQDGEHPVEMEEFRERFAWSDSLANIYAGIRRDATWALYLLSSFAVFTAVAGALQLWPHQYWFWPVTELITLFMIVIIYTWVSRRDLHRRWLFHRFLAEQIRYTRFGYPLLTFQMPFTVPLRQAFVTKKQQTQIRFTNPESWILRRMLVSVGQPTMFQSTIYHPTRLTSPLSRYVVDVIHDQRQYHGKTHHRMHIIKHRLHNLTKLSFIATALAVLAHFYWHESWLLIFTAALPSFAAAIHGIVTTNEFGRVSDLSKQTDQKLHLLQLSLANLENLPNNDAMTWLELREITHQSASVMSNVNLQWQELIEFQETSLPA